MDFATAIRTCLAKYATFSGRASRPEYWFFFLFIVMVQIVAGVVDWVFFTSVTTIETGQFRGIVAVSNQPVQSLTGLALFLPHLAAAWRRMHDTGRSGIYVLLPMILMFGAAGILLFGIGLADLFAGGGSFDLLFTRLTLLVVVPTLMVLTISPLLVLWWLTRPSQPGPNDYGPNPHEVTP